MKIEVDLAAPPHRDSIVAEFHVTHGKYTDIPAEVYLENGILMIAIYSAQGGIAWEYSVSEFVKAIANGMSILEKQSGNTS
jgi:hypothetical protein